MAYANYIDETKKDLCSHTEGAYSDCVNIGISTGSGHSNSGYNNRHNDHGNFMGYPNHKNSGYNNHSNIPSSSHSNTACRNHTNSTYAGYCTNYGHNNHSDYVYNNHNNYSYCNKYYYNTSSITIPAPAAYTLSIASTAPDNWTTLRSAVPDLKKLRDEIVRLSTTKVQKSGANITTTPTVIENTDAKLAPGAPARRAQINETISQIDNLYQLIKGNASGLTEKPVNSLRRKTDYKNIINKAQELASIAQPPTVDVQYGNHTNTNYNNHSNCQDHSNCSQSYTHYTPGGNRYYYGNSCPN